MRRRQTRLSRPPTPLHHAQNRSKRSVTHRLPTSPFGPHRKTLRGYATREDASLGHHAGCVHGHHAGSTGPRLRLGPRPAGLLFASGPEGARRGAADVLEETHCVPRALLRRAKWSSTLSCAAQSLPRAKLTLLGLRLWPDLELLVRDTAPRSRSARARVPAQCASSACCPLSAVQRLTPFLCGAQTGSSKAAQSLASASLQQRIPGAECAVARPASVSPLSQIVKIVQARNQARWNGLGPFQCPKTFQRACQHQWISRVLEPRDRLVTAKAKTQPFVDVLP